MSRTDTICAISTPAGVGGIAIVRLSGTDARDLAEGVLRKTNGRPLVLSNHRALLANLYRDNNFLDEVVATYFAAPHSYSGEDLVEIACHGSLYIQQQTLELLIAHGARLAEPGEFTLRAFLNGRMNLSQAEAVADLIDSQSQTSHQLAVSQLRGGYAKELEQLRQQLIDTDALMELELDFSEEDLQFANRKQLRAQVDEIKKKVQYLVDSFQAGNALKRGIPVAIVGRPNVGKSTLLNALLHDDRAIVSDRAGTTRDTIEEQFVLDGITFRLIDTAGLRHSDDIIEQKGIERSRRAIQQARIILYLTDQNDEIAESYSTNTEAAKTNSFDIDTTDMEGKTLILLRNKCDLDPVAPISQHQTKINNDNIIVISAKKGTNIDQLHQRLVEVARQGIDTDSPLLTNARHYEAFQHVLKSLSEVEQGLNAGLTPDLVTIDIRDALYHLGTITGKITNEEVLTSIFTRFCVGK